MQAHPRLCSLLGFLIGGVGWLAVASSGTLAWADEVYDWNIAGFDITVAGGQNPILISRTMAMMHLAIHDALNAIDRRYEPYLSERRAESTASPGAAVAAAARDVLASRAFRKSFTSFLAQPVVASPRNCTCCVRTGG